MALKLIRSILFAKDVTKLARFYREALELRELESEFPPKSSQQAAGALRPAIADSSWQPIQHGFLSREFHVQETGHVGNGLGSVFCLRGVEEQLAGFSVVYPLPYSFPPRAVAHQTDVDRTMCMFGECRRPLIPGPGDRPTGKRQAEGSTAKTVA